MKSAGVIARASAGDIAVVQGLWREYWESLGLTPEFQNFAAESAGLPGVYAAPLGCLLIARVEGEAAGTAAFRPLSAEACEAKRLYVRPVYRGSGLGVALLRELMREARVAGYREMYGDTLPSMQTAMKLYDQVGFVEVAAYSPNPTPGAKFMRLTL